MEKEVQLVNPKKATTSDSISPKILKISSKISADALQSLINDMLKTGNFPDDLKNAKSPQFLKRKILCTR